MMLVAITGGFSAVSMWIFMGQLHMISSSLFSGFFVDLTGKNARDIWNHGIFSGNLSHSYGKWIIEIDVFPLKMVDLSIAFC